MRHRDGVDYDSGAHCQLTFDAMQPHIHCYYSKFQSLKNVRTQFLEQLVGRPAENKLIGQRNYRYGLAKSMFSIEGDGESVVK